MPVQVICVERKRLCSAFAADNITGNSKFLLALSVLAKKLELLRADLVGVFASPRLHVLAFAVMS